MNAGPPMDRFRPGDLDGPKDPEEEEQLEAEKGEEQADFDRNEGL
jgi:hypothetical protein